MLSRFEDVEARVRMEEDRAAIRAQQAAQAYKEATGILQQWLTARGFQVQETDSGSGYFVKSTNVTKHWDNYFTSQRAVMYRASPVTSKVKVTVKEKLREVASVLNELGSPWDVDENQRGYLVLVVTISDVLKDDLARLTSKP